MPRCRIDPDSNAVAVKVWLPPDLRDALKARAVAARQPLSVFLREALLRGGLPRPVPAINRDAWQRLAGLAANLNQVSAALHLARLAHRPGDFRALPALVANLRKEVASLRASLVDSDV